MIQIIIIIDDSMLVSMFNNEWFFSTTEFYPILMQPLYSSLNNSVRRKFAHSQKGS